MEKLSILLADNNPDYRDSLARVLIEEGFRTRTASTVEDACELLRIDNYDLALVDLRLTDDGDDQDFSGLIVARLAASRSILCMIITAFPTVASAREALRMRGAVSLSVDYLTKTEGPEAVIAAIRGLQGISFLHISDLHPKPANEGDVHFDQEQAYGGFLKDLTSQSGLALNPIKGMIVAGDVSYRCEPSSFDWAGLFLADLAAQIGVPMHEIMLVPGNHDIDREKARAAGESEYLLPKGASFDKYNRYLEFTRSFYGEPAFTPDKLYRIFTFENRVALVAFNSCLMEGNGRWRCKPCMEERGKEHYVGWIDRQQVLQANKELNDWGVPALRIGAFHHHVGAGESRPPVSGCQGDHLWTYHHQDHLLKFTFYASGFRLLLYGHRHKADLRQSTTVGSSVPMNFGSGTFWKTQADQEETANYLLLQLSPIPGKSRVIMRNYAPATPQRPGHWGIDDSIQPDGLVSLPNTVIPRLPYE